MTDEYYETSDLGLAASLSACGNRLAKVLKTDPRRVVFCFDHNAAIREQIDLYWSGELQLSAALLMEHIKQLKGRIYS